MKDGPFFFQLAELENLNLTGFFVPTLSLFLLLRFFIPFYNAVFSFIFS
jgi:hypothetical protein